MSTRSYSKEIHEDFILFIPDQLTITPNLLPTCSSTLLRTVCKFESTKSCLSGYIMEVNLAIHIYISWGLGWGKYKYESLCSIPAIDRLFDQTDQSRRQVWRFIALASPFTGRDG